MTRYPDYPFGWAATRTSGQMADRLFGNVSADDGKLARLTFKIVKAGPTPAVQTGGGAWL
jgi:hypothetical protein